MLDNFIGLTLDKRYEIENLVSSGGMGIVYTAHDRLLGRQVAIKIIRPEYIWSSELVGQLAIGLQIRIAAPEPARWRRRARSRRRRRLPFHTKGVGLAFHPSTVCSNQSMIC